MVKRILTNFEYGLCYKLMSRYLRFVKTLILFLLPAASFILGTSCNVEPPPLPDPTNNNSIDSAWNVTLPYTYQVTVPATDSAEVFHFGIGSDKNFGSILLIKVKLIEPKKAGFYLRAELLTSKDLALLVDSRNSELEPAAWIASKSNQLYYLRLTQNGDPDTDRFTYSVEISKTKINDPFEPDDDTANATPLELGFPHDGSYLCDAFSDSVEPMLSLPDYYEFELEDTTLLYIKAERIGGDAKPVLKLIKPDGSLFKEVRDTLAVIDLITPYKTMPFDAGTWFLEVTDETGFYPSWGKGEVAYNYLEPYVITVSKTPQ